MKSEERQPRVRIRHTANLFSSIIILFSSIAGISAIGLGIWRLSLPIDERAINESTAMAGLVDMGRSLVADVARVVQPAIDRTNKLALDADVIAALREGNADHETNACNHAVQMSTEIDAVALFDRQGNIQAINTVYGSGQKIPPERIDRVLQTSYVHREIVQRCIRNTSRAKALEFQTACTITPALFDSTGLSVAYSVPVFDPQAGERIGVISSRIRFDRLLNLIKGRSVGGAKDSVEFVTDGGSYFSEEINSGQRPPPIPTQALSKIVDPLIKGGTDYCIAQYETDHVGLFRLKSFNTLDGGGLVVMLIGGKGWLAGEARKSSRLEAAAITASGIVLLLLTSLLSVNHRLRVSEQKSHIAQVASRTLAEQLAKSEAFARSTVDALSAHIAILDEQAKIVAVNQAWGSYGVSNSKVTGPWGPGANYLDACRSARGDGMEDAQAMANGIQAVIRGEKKEFALEYACHSPGERRWFVGTVTRFPGDGPVHVVVQHQNITHLVLIKEQLKTAKEAAEAATRLKSEFLANMSHEIRTPITAILGFADLMLDPDQTQHGRIVGLHTIRRNAKQLLDLINEILDLSKIEAGRMTVERIPTELQHLVSDVFSMMQPRAAEKGIALNLRSRGAVPRRVMIDPLRARQILTNLVTNAVKFTERGQIEICVYWEPADQMLAFEVNDTGIGIAEDQIDKLFLPFTQADSSTTRRFGGTGLGLTISRRLAHLLGGDITARSSLGVGSTFTAKIMGPADGAGECFCVEDTLISSVIHPPSSHGTISGKILLAEDGKDNQLFISAMLRKAGAEVVIASNGRTAVDRASAESFDVVLMDMQMPELDGYAASAELRHRGFQKPIIALTAHAMADDRAKCIDSGCTDYLTKPIDRKLLIETVAKYLQKSETVATQSTATNQIFSTLADDSLIAELLPTYIEHLPQQIASITNSLAQHDLNTLSLSVHRLKGSGGSYGFECLTNVAGKAESSLRQHESLDVIKQQIDSLVEMVRSIRGYDPKAEVVVEPEAEPANN